MNILNIVGILKVFIEIVFLAIYFLLSPILKFIANYGYGSDQCLNSGFLPLPLHYHSPVPDIRELQNKNYWVTSKSEMPGITFPVNQQLNLATELGRKDGEECLWHETQDSNERIYYNQNPSFGYASACLLYSIVRYYKPARFIEIGSGFSTLIAAQALGKNKNENDIDSQFIAIEPYPGKIFRQHIRCLTSLIENGLEDIPITTITSLGRGELLFIDSSHVVRIGGDVNTIYLQILPRFTPGVLVHVHDIHLPYEYPIEYFTNKKKYLWTEQYLLEAFLTHNPNFEILLAAYWLGREHLNVFASAYTHFDKNKHRINTSFYLRSI
jgi:hypothetical protein